MVPAISLANDNAVTDSDYDVMGNRLRKRTLVDAQSYLRDSQYDAGGRLLHHTYPDGAGSGRKWFCLTLGICSL
jgi:hypothetical protein